MDFLQNVYLFLASLGGSALNALAGGGSFFTFPALIFAGVPILNANATSTLALLPGSVFSAYTFRDRIGVSGRPLALLGMASIFGSIIGSFLLIYTPTQTLKHILPFLLLVATLLLIFKNPLSRSRLSHLIGGSPNLGLIFQFMIAIYGGYFGGGIGILMLASFNLMGYSDMVQMNALKAFLGSAINLVALTIFIFKGLIVWKFALVMFVGSVVGGYAGFTFGTRLPPRLLHLFIIFMGVVLTAYFFVQAA